MIDNKGSFFPFFKFKSPADVFEAKIFSVGEGTEQGEPKEVLDMNTSTWKLWTSPYTTYIINVVYVLLCSAVYLWKHDFVRLFQRKAELAKL